MNLKKAKALRKAAEIKYQNETEILYKVLRTNQPEKRQLILADCQRKYYQEYKKAYNDGIRP